MKCGECRREIRSHEVNKLVAETVQPDGTVTFFGFTQPDGTWERRTGRLRVAWHWKCWNIVRKRSERTGVTTSMAKGEAPTAYTMTGGDTSFLTERNQRVLDLAEELKVGTDSWTIRELMRAIEYGVVIKEQWGHYVSDGYGHTHSLPQAPAGLAAHLRYAHGHYEWERMGITSIDDGKQFHSELHAVMSGKAIEQSRVDDDGLESEPGAGLEWPAGGTSTVEL